MPLHFPKPEETMLCPHCGEKTGFSLGGSGTRTTDTQISLAHEGPKMGGAHTIAARFCRTCGGPVIRHSVNLHEKKPVVIHIYPEAPTRPKAPAEVGEADTGLEKDFNQAVACEPHSNHAAVSLLGRCVERILVAKCDVKHKRDNGHYRMLGELIPDAIKTENFPDEIRNGLDDGFRYVRNQAAHPWKDEDGNDLDVKDAVVGQCFAIVNYLIHRYYVTPEQSKQFVAAAQGAVAQQA